MLLALVSARTGRPAAALTGDLELTADLRLDSLARVELLAALRARIPDLPEITVAEVLGFRTLGELQAAVEGRPHRIRHVRTIRPRTLPGLRTADLRGTLVITGDGRGTAQEVRAHLAAQGIAATMVDEVPYGATGVIFLGGLRDDVTHVHAEALHAAREERRLFVTVQDTGGDFGRSGTAREQAGGLAGLTRHLRSEWPDSTIRAFDIPRGPDTAQLISTELLHGGAAEAVGYPDVRHELSTEPTHVPDLDNVIVVAGTTPAATLEAVAKATASDPISKVCLVLTSPDDRTQAMNNETLMCLAATHGWSAITPDDEARGHDFRAEVHPGPLVDESRSPISWLIEWFVAASGATTLREVSLLRDPGTGTGPITVRGHGKRLALVSNVTHGRAMIAPASPSAPSGTTPAVTVRGARLLGRPLEHSRTDPAATDECLCLAARWAHEEFGGTAVVTSVREVRVHRTGLLSTSGKAALSPGKVQDGHAECDVVLTDGDGSARLDLLGVRLVRHPR